jgi:hypothetical protein
MLRDIVSVKPLSNYRLKLKFEDDVEGIVDVMKMVRMEGIFAPLLQQDFFKMVTINSEIGTICWPNGADLDPDVLYAQITGEPLPAFEENLPYSSD